MTVLNLAFLGDPGSVHVRRWLGFFVRQGHSVHLLVTAEREAQARLTAADPTAPNLRGVVVVALAPYPRSRVPFIGYLEARAAMRDALRDIRPDVLHAQYLTGDGWLARVSGFRPYAITTWGSDVYLDAPSSIKHRLFARLALGGADLITADSRDLADATIRLGAPAERVRIVQFGVDTDRFSPGPPPEDLRASLRLEGRRVILSPRAITPLYGHELVIRALPRLADDVTAVFVCFNAQAASVAALKAEAVGLGLERRVRFVPAIPHTEMPAYLRLADVVVSTPFSDGTPVTVLEAMAVGRPVVVTDLPSLREWLADIDPVALVPTGDVDALARAIRTMLDRDPGSAATIAGIARARVVKQADEGDNLRQVELQYEAMASRRRYA